MAEINTLSGYEPKDVTEFNDTEVLSMFFHRSTTSTYDSAESIATLPLESDLDDQQCRDMLASPLYLRERERSKCRVKNLASDRVDISLANRAVQRKMQHYPDFLNRKKDATLLLEEQRNQLLSQAKAETMKQ